MTLWPLSFPLANPVAIFITILIGEGGGRVRMGEIGKEGNMSARGGEGQGRIRAETGENRRDVLGMVIGRFFSEYWA